MVLDKKTKGLLSSDEIDRAIITDIRARGGQARIPEICKGIGQPRGVVTYRLVCMELAGMVKSIRPQRHTVIYRLLESATNSHQASAVVERA